MARKTIVVYVHPTFNVISCKTKQDEQARGLMGFHDYNRCPACEVIPLGFEFWTEHGYKNGSVDLNTNLDTYLEQRGKQRNETYLAGGPMYFAAGNNDNVGPTYGIPKR